MKKKLDTTSVMNELRGQSAFFPRPEEQPKEQYPSAASDSLVLPVEDTAIKSDAIMLASKQDSLHDSKLACKLAPETDIIEIIRKIVKSPAKEEVLYVRLTKEEKTQLGDIEYTYTRQGMETNANALGRIALNFLIADYKANGENSILAKVLKSLNS